MIFVLSERFSLIHRRWSADNWSQYAGRLKPRQERETPPYLSSGCFKHSRAASSIRADPVRPGPARGAPQPANRGYLCHACRRRPGDAGGPAAPHQPPAAGRAGTGGGRAPRGPAGTVGSAATLRPGRGTPGVLAEPRPAPDPAHQHRARGLAAAAGRTGAAAPTAAGLRPRVQVRLEDLDKILREEKELHLDTAGRLVGIVEHDAKHKGEYRLCSATDPEATCRNHGGTQTVGYNVSLAVTPHGIIREIAAATGAEPDAAGVARLVEVQRQERDECPDKLVTTRLQAVDARGPRWDGSAGGKRSWWPVSRLPPARDGWVRRPLPSPSPTAWCARSSASPTATTRRGMGLCLNFRPKTAATAPWPPPVAVPKPVRVVALGVYQRLSARRTPGASLQPECRFPAGDETPSAGRTGHFYADRVRRGAARTRSRSGAGRLPGQDVCGRAQSAHLARALGPENGPGPGLMGLGEAGRAKNQANPASRGGRPGDFYRWEGFGCLVRIRRFVF